MTTEQRQKCIANETEASDWVEDGMMIAIGEPPPMGLLRHIIRRGIKDLTIISSGISLDILIAAGCVRKTIAYHASGGVGVPVVPSFRRAAEQGQIEVWECEEGILTSGLEAAGKGLPYLPWRAGVGTSLPEVNADLKVITDPIKGDTLIAVPAIKPDIAILHAATSDVYGNVQHIGGPGWIDLFLYRAAERSIIQVEKIISNEEVRANAWHTTIAGADAIVRMPYGAHPFYSRGYYVQDVPFVQAYLSAATAAQNQEPSALEEYLNYYCREPETHADYLERVGIKRLLSLYEY